MLFRPAAVRLAPLALLLFIAPLALAQADSNTTFASLSCTSFEWLADGSNERAALVVPVVLDGQPYRLQLDTGANHSLVYGTIAQDRGWAVVGGGPRLVPSAEVGGMSLGAFHMGQHAGMTPDDEVQGTLGLDLLFGRITVLDYPGQRFCLMERGEAPEDLWMGTAWSNAEVRDGKLFVPLTLDGRALDAFAFDTGSSSTALITDYAPWQEMTGLPDSTAAPKRFSATSWGEVLTALGGPVQGRLQIAGTDVPDAWVYTTQEATDIFSSAPFRIAGLIGNASLWDRVVVLDLGVDLRFGLAR